MGLLSLSIPEIMKRNEFIQLILAAVVLGLAGISPNLFAVAEAGIAPLSRLAYIFLLPSVILIFVVVVLTRVLKYDLLRKQIRNGIVAGLAGTVGLEIVREAGFRLGGMPGDMPRLLGVLLLDRFAYGPNFLSNVAGWSYHFWNGAAFGMVFSLLVGHGKKWMGVVYGILVGTGFMASPVPRALGIGSFGLEFRDGYQFALTVTLAHIAFGMVSGWLICRMNKGMPDILTRVRLSFVCPLRIGES